MKKILFICFNLDRGGAQLLLKNIIKGLSTSLYSSFLWSPCDGDLKKDFDELQMPVYIENFEIDRINRDKTIIFNSKQIDNINKIIKKFREKKYRTAIRCSGTVAQKLLEEFDFSGVNLIGIFDNNPSLFGREANNIKIFSISEIDKYNIDACIIAHTKSKFFIKELQNYNIKHIYDIYGLSIKDKFLKFTEYLKDFVKPVKFFIKINPDIVYVNNANNFWAVIIGKLMGKKVIWAIHEGFAPNTFRVYPQFLYFWAFKIADKFIFPSVATYDYYKNYIKKDKVNIIYNGINLKEIENFKLSDTPEITKNELGIPKEHKVILNVSIFNIIKGLEYFVKGAIQVLETSANKDLTFVLVGQNYSAYGLYISDLIEKSQYKNNFKIIPATENVFKYFNIADIYVTSSLSETFCISNLEAAAFNKPIISTNVCGIPEAIIKDKTGILIPVEDLENQISKNILSLLNNQERIFDLTKAGYQNLAENFTYEVMMQKYLNIFASLN